MKVMDNSPIDVPAVGKLVKEQFAVGQFADCCLYALPSNTGTMVEKTKEVLDGWLKSMGAEKLLNKYDFEELGNMPVLNNHPTLKKAIEDEECQFLLPLYTPSKEEKLYLLLKTEEDKLYKDIALLLYSERISKHSMNELLKEFAKDTPEQFCDGLKDIVKSEKFWKNYFISLANDMFHPTFGMRASEPKIKEVLKIDGIITHQKKNEMIDRMMDNITSFRKGKGKDEKAEAELNYVLSSLDIESLKKFLTRMSKKQLETFCKTANPKVLAEESTMKLEIRYEGKIDPVKKADGKYRLHLCKNCKDVQVHFGRREAFILYLIYMIDKHERDTVDTLKIESFKTQFKNLYEAVYAKDGTAEVRFDKMIRHTDHEGNPQQAQIKHCYLDIRMAVSDGCEVLRELPAPFILADAKDHLYAQKSKISVPKVLIDMMK